MNETAGAAISNRTARGRFRNSIDGQYLQLVISASYDLVRSHAGQEIIDLCLRELGDVVPATREAKLVKSTVIKEINATFSPAPGVDQWRPRPAPP